MTKTLHPTHKGTSVPITYNSLGHIKEVEKHGKFFEYGMLEAISKLPYRPGICMDIGANIGNHTVFFSKFCKFDKVWAFEPTISSCKILKDNVVLTNCYNVNIYNKAVGPVIGYANMYENEDNPSWNNISEYGGPNEIKVYATKTIQISTISTKEKVALMKIDVEGFELEVIKGAYEVIEREKPELFIETHGKPEDLLRSLPKGYRLIKRYNNSPTYHFSDSADFFIKDVL